MQANAMINIDEWDSPPALFADHTTNNQSLFVGSHVELNGVRMSLTPSATFHVNNYVDILISLDSNPGIWGFLFNVVFDETKLTHVSTTPGHDLRDLRLTLPSVGEAARPNHLIFHSNSENVTHEVGFIATMRFRVISEIENEPPITFGNILVMADDGFSGIETSSVLIDRGIASPMEARANVGIHSDLEIQPRGIVPFQEQDYKDITDDFECPNFLNAVRELTGVFDRPIYNTDIFELVLEGTMFKGSMYRWALDLSGRRITNLAGIEHFRVIQFLDIGNNQLTVLNLPRRYTRNLQFLNASNNQLTGLDISHLFS